MNTGPGIGCAAGIPAQRIGSLESKACSRQEKLLVFCVVSTHLSYPKIRLSRRIINTHLPLGFFASVTQTQRKL
jgi:hypothetical protein